MLFELWCWRRLLSVLNSKEIKAVNPKGNQSWILMGRTDAEAEAPIPWTPDMKSDSLEKTLILGKIEGRSRRDDRGWDGWMASPGDGEGQGSLACCHPWGCTELDMTEWLNNNNQFSRIDETILKNKFGRFMRPKMKTYGKATVIKVV